MEFNQKELEYLLTCLNFHYESNDDEFQEQVLDINCQLELFDSLLIALRITVK